MNNAIKYVCKNEDLDKLLPDSVELPDGTVDNLKKKFQDLFPDPSSSDDKTAWRMYYKNTRPQTFLLQKFGIKYDKPTVRDAVAFDLVKLDDESNSVSNDFVYSFDEHMGYSPMEYERYLLNRNYRINLVNLETDWCDISYQGRDADSTGGNAPIPPKRRRTVDKVYQGARMSDTLLEYFSKMFDLSVDPQDVHVPFTNSNDFTTEVSLIPHTHPDFRPITSRAYYDMKYRQYLKKLKKYGITAIATFALVDDDKYKNHTGRFLVKLQEKLSETSYVYILAVIDQHGKLFGVPHRFTSSNNTILCVCADDFGTFYDDGTVSDRTVVISEEKWTPRIYDIPVEKSTTSSHYSVFRQRIPEYDLKQVRHYFQFKNRLEGMELFLEDLKRNVYRKEVQAAECFAKETMVLERLFKEFSKNSELMELVMKYYDLVYEWDELVVKRRQLIGIKDDKVELLDRLIQEYNGLSARETDKKLELGSKISSLKLELNKSIQVAIESIEERMRKIYVMPPEDDSGTEVRAILTEMDEIRNRGIIHEQTIKNVFGEIKEVFSSSSTETEGLKDDEPPRTSADVKKRLEARMEAIRDKLNPTGLYVDSTQTALFGQTAESSISSLEHGLADSTNGSLWTNYDKHLADQKPRGYDESSRPPELELDNKTLHKYILQSERWRGFMMNLGYELKQFKTMLTMCEDATIKVRRLVHNFKEKMERVEKDVWNDDHVIRKDFSFTDIAASSLKEIILLHDWYASNAPGKTYEEMGFNNEDEFMEFRRNCNKISYNLRKNQYAKMIALRKDKLQNRIQSIREKLENRHTLQYDDKYGWEAKKLEDEETRKWSIKDVSKKQAERTVLFVQAQRVIQGIDSESQGELEAPDASSIDLKPYVNAQDRLEKKYADDRTYSSDLEKLVDRTISYLKSLGIAETEQELEALVVRNKALYYKGDVYGEIQKLQKSKDELDKAIGTMTRHRNAMSRIIQRITDSQLEIQNLERKNKAIFNACLYERDKQSRNRMLIEKMENESRILGLKGIVKGIKKSNSQGFMELENMRKEVDGLQSDYDSQVKQFKDTIGLDQEAIYRLLVGVYNKYQGEILEHDDKTRKNK